MERIIDKGVVYYKGKDVSDRIKNRMAEVGHIDEAGYISPSELAYKCDMPRNSITDILAGRRRIKKDELKKIAKILYVSEEYLLYGNGEIYDAPKIKTPVDMLMRNFAWSINNCGMDIEEALKQLQLII